MGRPARAARRPFTYEDYLRIPDDGRRCQVLEGEIEVPPSPSPAHQREVGRLYRVLAGHVEKRQLGQVFMAPLDIVLGLTNIVQPDLIFVSNDRSAIITARNIQGAPDLAVEVLSDSTAATDRIRKSRIYAKHGVLHYWLVDPQAETIEALVLEKGAYRPETSAAAGETFRPALFPGLAIRLSRLFL